MDQALPRLWLGTGRDSVCGDSPCLRSRLAAGVSRDEEDFGTAVGQVAPRDTPGSDLGLVRVETRLAELTGSAKRRATQAIRGQGVGAIVDSHVVSGSRFPVQVSGQDSEATALGRADDDENMKTAYVCIKYPQHAWQCKNEVRAQSPVPEEEHAHMTYMRFKASVRLARWLAVEPKNDHNYVRPCLL